MNSGYILIAAGLFTLVMTIIKPAFYWGSRRAMRMRRLLGDTLASVFYIVLGLMLIVIGFNIM